jgi:hypothetical protein
MAAPVVSVTCQVCHQIVGVHQVGGQNYPIRHKRLSGRWCMGTVFPVPPSAPAIPVPGTEPPKAG